MMAALSLLMKIIILHDQRDKKPGNSVNQARKFGIT